VHPGDLVILISYAAMDNEEARSYLPRIVFVDNTNQILEHGTDPGHAPEGSGLFSGAIVDHRVGDAIDQHRVGDAIDQHRVGEAIDQHRIDQPVGA
jgi:hypothetical protein